MTSPTPAARARSGSNQAGEADDRTPGSRAVAETARQNDRSERSEAAAGNPPTPREVAFLFTDIEGSTRLIERSESRYRHLLAVHHRILRGHVARRGGTEFHDGGDGFFFAFDDPQEAADSATAIQTELGSTWVGEQGAPKVRMALHWGAAQFLEGQYRGTSIHLTARLLAAAHGGQILASREFADRIRPDGPARAKCVGTYRLRGFSRQQTVFQIQADGLATEFPELHADHARTHNLPAEVGPFVGREAELRTLLTWLDPANPATRIVSVTGLGGIGKSRLALEAATRLLDRYDHGVIYVAADEITSAESIPHRILDALGISPQNGWDPLAEIEQKLRPVPNLFFLDGVERVSDELSALLGALAARLPLSKFVVCSRVRLGHGQECELRLDPLGLPDKSLPASEVRATDAVGLFLAAAARARSGFAVDDEEVQDVAEVCRLLGGLPLAIELAAARIQVVSVSELLSALRSERDEGGRGRGEPGASAALEDVFAWSCRLLPGEIAEFLYALSVFRGGWDASAAARVSGIDDRNRVLGNLHYLLTCSLIGSSQTRSGMRFEMLSPLQQICERRLGDRAAETAHRHARYFHRVAWEIASKLGSPEERTAASRFSRDVPNVLAAIEREPDGARRQKMAVTFHGYAIHYGLATEVRRLFQHVTPDETNPVSTAEAWIASGTLDFALRRFGPARSAFEHALEIARESNHSHLCRVAEHNIGLVLAESGDLARAIGHHEAALAYFDSTRETGHQSTVRINLARLYSRSGEHAKALATYFECIDGFRQAGDSGGLSMALNSTGNLLSHLGRLADAKAALAEGLALAIQLDRINALPSMLASVAHLAAGSGNWSQAAYFAATARQFASDHDVPLDERTLAEIEFASESARKHLGREELEAAIRESLDGEKADWLDRCESLKVSMSGG